LSSGRLLLGLAPAAIWVATSEMVAIRYVSLGGSASFTIWYPVWVISGLLYLIASPILLYGYFQSRNPTGNLATWKKSVRFLLEVLSWAGSFTFAYLVWEQLAYANVLAAYAVLTYPMSGMVFALPAVVILASGYLISRMR
jgi:hypothetical protein